MEKIKLVAESLQEWDQMNTNKEENLNESSKGELQTFLKDPEKNTKAFLNAYAAQFSKKGGDKLKTAIDKLKIEDKKTLAQQSLKALEEDPEKGYAWIFIKDNKIQKAGALSTKKGDLGSELGVGLHDK